MVKLLSQIRNGTITIGGALVSDWLRVIVIAIVTAHNSQQEAF